MSGRGSFEISGTRKEQERLIGLSPPFPPVIPRQLLSPFCCLQRSVCPLLLLLLLLLLCQQRTVCSPAYDFLACVFLFFFFLFSLPFPLSVGQFLLFKFHWSFFFSVSTKCSCFCCPDLSLFFFFFIYFLWHVSCMGSLFLFLLISKFLEDNLIFFRISCCIHTTLPCLF